MLTSCWESGYSAVKENRPLLSESGEDRLRDCGRNYFDVRGREKLSSGPRTSVSCDGVGDELRLGSLSLSSTHTTVSRSVQLTRRFRRSSLSVGLSVVFLVLSWCNMSTGDRGVGRREAGVMWRRKASATRS